MKATELMLEDFVFHKGLVCEVVAIDPMGYIRLRYLKSSKVDEFGNKDYQLFVARPEDVHPIPLSREVLEKIGFVKIGDGYLLTGRPANSISLRSLAPVVFVMRISSRHVQIRSVHNLQHLMRECGIEKEITL